MRIFGQRPYTFFVLSVIVNFLYIRVKEAKTHRKCLSIMLRYYLTLEVGGGSAEEEGTNLLHSSLESGS